MRLNNKQKEGLANICDDIVKAIVVGIGINQQFSQEVTFSGRLSFLVAWYIIMILFLTISLVFRKGKSNDKC